MPQDKRDGSIEGDVRQATNRGQSGNNQKPGTRAAFDASIPGQLLGAARGQNPIPGTGKIYDAVANRGDKGVVRSIAGGIADQVFQGLPEGGATIGRATTPATGGIADFARNTLADWSGGDRNQLDGGQYKYRDMGGRIIDDTAAGYSKISDTAKAGTRSLLGIDEIPQPTTQPQQEAPQNTAAVATPTATATTPNQSQAGAIDAGLSQPPLTTSSGRQINLPDGVIGSRSESGRLSFGDGIGADLPEGSTVEPVGSIQSGTPSSRQGGKSQAASPAFVKALAAGDYEAALQSVNPHDTAQMERLGQLQGRIRAQRESQIDRRTDSQRAVARQADRTREQMLRQAESLAFSGNALRARRMAEAARQLGDLTPAEQASGIAAGMDPAADLATIRTNEASATKAEEEAASMQRAGNAEGIMQGILEQLSDPRLDKGQRQALTQQYSALRRAGGKASDGYLFVDQIIGTDLDGKPVTARVAVDPMNGQVLDGGQRQTQTQQQAGPPPGTVQDGYRFKGGNPNDQSNWELI